MNAPVLRFCDNLESSGAASELSNYQPPTFPPPDGFYVSVDEAGKPLSQYSDDYWDFRAYGFFGFNFAKHSLSLQNNALLKQAIFLYLYDMKLFPGKISSIKEVFKALAKLCKFADSHDITVDQIYRFPRLASAVIEAFSPTLHSKLITVLSQLLRSEENLGWKIADTAFIEELARLQVPHISTQNAYIPPRIWISLVRSCERVMDDFERHQTQLFDAWTWLSDAYRHNIEHRYSQRSPFLAPDVDTGHCPSPSRAQRRVYPGGAEAFFADYGVAELLNRWVGYVPSQQFDQFALTAYMNLVRDSAFTFILAHSIQRSGEGLSLRADCFDVDDDPNLGKVAMLVGETTKTDPDSDARWVVPMTVGRAVNLLNDIARLRLDTTPLTVAPEINANSYLMTGAVEHWSGGKVINMRHWYLDNFVTKYPLAFDQDEMRITEEDYKIAYQLTPKLTEKDWFEIGSVWSFTAHQLRRTLAVNLFASDVPESVIQWMMKHQTLNQSYYYGRNYTRLRVNRNANDAVLVEAHRSTVRTLIEVAENTLGENVHATGTNLIAVDTLHLIEERDHKKLERLAKKGQIACRQTLLGFCMTESCEYGGVESAVHCAGVDGKGPCKDAVFSKKNKQRLKALFDDNEQELNDLVENTPRHSKLKAENEAIEVYFHATS